MNCKIIGKIFFGALLFSSISAQAQDLIAMQAPIDRHTKSVDSVVLKRLIERENIENPSGDLYASWNTSVTHCYKDGQLPSTFKIDLRHFAMPTTSRRVTSNFGYRPAFRRYHKGLDIKVYVGDTIRSAFNGKVRRVAYEPGGYGNYVVIRHPNGLETIYAHMSKHLVDINQEVKAGEPIGLGGNTGHSTGSHLHFECRLLGKAIDPSLLFDFSNQDVTGDYYVYHRDDNSSPANTLLARTNETENHNDEEEVIETSGHYHKVSAGETLLSIAKKRGISVDDLCRFNHLTLKSHVRPGQILRY